MNLHNISVISHYEVKLLRRSWLFRIFAVMALLGITLTILNQQTRLFNAYRDTWSIISMSSMMPFVCTYFYNIVQSIIVIFLSGSFLKRDKKLDTAEVIYVRPMSNADYIIGKTWGIIQVFMSLNIIVLLITAFLNILVNQSPFSIYPYLFYLLTISFPSLLFVLGLSFTLTCLLKNQAVTLIVMLGLIGVTFFYLKNTLNGVFDFFGVNIPAIFSDEIGHSNLPVYLLQRSIYLLAGIGLISFTIALVKRLPHRPWKVIIVNSIGAFFVIAGCCIGLLYVLHFQHITDNRTNYIAIYKQYEPQSKVHVLTNHITVEPKGQKLEAESEITVRNNNVGKVDNLIFYLNPSLKVSAIETNGTPLNFRQEQQVIVIDKAIEPQEEFSLKIKYSGGIDENICYTDIENNNFFDTEVPNVYFRYGKRYAWLEDSYVLLTPECIWYPVSIPPTNPATPYRIGKNFTDYTLTVLNVQGKEIISQGQNTQEDGKTIFTNPSPLTGISLSIGNYEKKSVTVDSANYEIYYFKGHDFFTKYFPDLTDTLATVLKEKISDVERDYGRDYPFSKFVLAETPIQFATYIRNWKGYSDYVQPEIVFIPERMATLNFDFQASLEQMKHWRSQNDGTLSETEKQINLFDWFVWNFRRQSSANGTDWQNPVVSKFYIAPMFLGYVNYIRSEQYPIFDVAFNNMSTTSTRMYSWNTIDDQQRANLYLEDKSFKMASEDADIKPEIFFELLKLKSVVLKNYIYSQIPEEEFNNFLKQFTLENSFKEIPLKELCHAIAEEFDIDITAFLEKWYLEDHSPILFIKDADANQVVIDEITRYQVKFKINNPSDVDGIVTAQIRGGGGGGGGRRGGGGGSSETPSNFVVPANSTQEIKIITDDRPAGIAVNTNISRNLPTLFNFNFSKITTTTSDTMSGMFPIDPSAFKADPNEIIIDNEDPGFRTTMANTRNKLNELFKKEDRDKYKNFYPWDMPNKWTLIAAAYCYGETIHSAVTKKKGSGANFAEWSANIPKDGYYEVFIWNPNLNQNRMYFGGGGGRRNQDERNQTYTLKYGSEKEEITLDLEKEESGWVSIGTFDLPVGVATITLTDKVSARYVIADAVRFLATTAKED